MAKRKAAESKAEVAGSSEQERDTTVAESTAASITARTSRSKYSFTWRRSPYYLFPLLCGAAVYCLYYLSFRNGLLDGMLQLIKQESPILPGTDATLITKYIGVDVIDRQLVTLVAFFAPVLNYASNDVTLFTIFGMGQFGAAWTLIMLESFRQGNHRKIVSYIGTYGLFVQNFSFAVSTPIYLLLHLYTSPVATAFPSVHASTVLIAAPHDMAILPFSIMLGYVVPSILMAMPAPEAVSYTTHQYFIALWQPFPLWTILIHLALKKLYLLAVGPKAQKATESSKAIAAPSATYLVSASRVYAFTLILCLLTHIPVLLIALFPASLVPSEWPQTFAFTQSTLSSIYLPPLPLPNRPFPSITAGCLAFLQWDLYIGATTSLIWGLVLYRNASVEKEIVDPNTSLPIYRELLSGERYPDRHLARTLLFKVLWWTAVSGPFGALTVLLWQRDAIVKQKIKQGI